MSNVHYGVNEGDLYYHHDMGEIETIEVTEVKVTDKYQIRFSNGEYCEVPLTSNTYWIKDYCRDSKVIYDEARDYLWRVLDSESPWIKLSDYHLGREVYVYPDGKFTPSLLSKHEHSIIIGISFLNDYVEFEIPEEAPTSPVEKDGRVLYLFKEAYLLYKNKLEYGD